MYDLIIKNGEIVRETAVERKDIGIRDGRIAQLFPWGTDANAKKVIDAEGAYIFPGGIDLHVHMNDLGAESMEDWPSGSYAAASSGITTVVDMPIDSFPSTADEKALTAKLERIKGRSYTDYLIWGGLTTDNLGEIRAMRKKGVAGLKAFLSDCGAPDFGRATDPVIYEAMLVAAKENFPLIIHAENEEMNQYYSAKYHSEKDWSKWSLMRPEAGEMEAVSKCILFAGLTGARIHIAHVSSAKTVEMISRARKDGVLVTCETCPHYLLFSEKDYARYGALIKCAPPLRSEENRKELWKMVARGDIDMISSDHSPNPEKKIGDPMSEAWAGVSGLQMNLLTLYSEGYKKGILSLEQIAQLFSLHAAQLLGIDEEKGSIEPGRDADLVIFDPDGQTKFGQDTLLTKVKTSAYQDRIFEGAVRKTFLRGHEVTAGRPEGEYICK